jgi:hypothetical protein
VSPRARILASLSAEHKPVEVRDYAPAWLIAVLLPDAKIPLLDSGCVPDYDFEREQRMKQIKQRITLISACLLVTLAMAGEGSNAPVFQLRLVAESRFDDAGPRGPNAYQARSVNRQKHFFTKSFGFR